MWRRLCLRYPFLLQTLMNERVGLAAHAVVWMAMAV